VGDWNGQEPGGLFPQIAGATQRWSGGHSGLVAPCDPASDATLLLHAHVDTHTADGPNRVLVNGVEVGRIDQPRPTLYRFAVPRALLAGRTVAEVTLDVRTWRPTDFGGGDSRALGVVLADVELIAAGAEQEPAATPPLRWALDPTALAACTRRLGQGATLVVPARQPAALVEAMAAVVAQPERFAPGAKPLATAAQAPSEYAALLADGTLRYRPGQDPDLLWEPAR